MSIIRSEGTVLMEAHPGLLTVSVFDGDAFDSTAAPPRFLGDTRYAPDGSVGAWVRIPGTRHLRPIGFFDSPLAAQEALWEAVQ